MEMHPDERCLDSVRLDGEERRIPLVSGLGALRMQKVLDRKGDAVNPLPDVAASLCAFSDH
jgi:hypothetical protein